MLPSTIVRLSPLRIHCTTPSPRSRSSSRRARERRPADELTARWRESLAGVADADDAARLPHVYGETRDRLDKLRKGARLYAIYDKGWNVNIVR